MNETPHLSVLVAEAAALIVAHEDPEHRYLTARLAADDLMRTVEERLRNKHGQVFNRLVDEWHTKIQPIGETFRAPIRATPRISEAFEAALNDGTVRRQIEEEGMSVNDLVRHYGLKHRMIMSLLIGWRFEFHRTRLPRGHRPSVRREKSYTAR